MLILLVTRIDLQETYSVDLTYGPALLSPVSPSVSTFKIDTTARSVAVVSVTSRQVDYSTVSETYSPLSNYRVRELSVSAPDLTT